MVAFSVLFYLATSLLPIDEIIHLTVSLLAAMPAMSSLVMMARMRLRHGRHLRHNDLNPGRHFCSSVLYGLYSCHRAESIQMRAEKSGMGRTPSV